VSENATFIYYRRLNQDEAHIPEISILEELTGTQSFGALLRQLRKQSKKTLQDIMTEMKTKHKIIILGAQLDGWEHFYIPSQQQKKVIVALDVVYKANGSLVRAWNNIKPKSVLTGYAIRMEDWPKKTQAQFARLVNYKTANSENLRCSDAPGGDRWTSDTAPMMFQRFCEAFFGFLVASNKCDKGHLSLTILCDWPLVVSFFQFHRKRVGRSDYTTLESSRTGVLRNLYRWFFGHLWKDAEEEERWNDKLPIEIRNSSGTLPWLAQDEPVVLQSFDERWQAHLHQARLSAKSFLKRNYFRRIPWVQRTDIIIKTGVPASDFAAALERLIYKLPGRICSRKAAVHCRRLAEAALLLAVPMNSWVLLGMRLDHIEIDAKLKAWLKIPEMLLRNRDMQGGRGGINGMLLKWDALHYVIRRYLEEARPILLGSVAQDARSLFISATSCLRHPKCESLIPGGPLDEKAFYHDFLSTLGFNPAALRYVIAADGFRNDKVAHVLPKILYTSSLNVKKTYECIRAVEKGEGANNSVKTVLTPCNRRAKGQISRH
jgi:hypothetical protein